MRSEFLRKRNEDIRRRYEQQFLTLKRAGMRNAADRAIDEVTRLFGAFNLSRDTVRSIVRDANYSEKPDAWGVQMHSGDRWLWIGGDAPGNISGMQSMAVSPIADTFRCATKKQASSLRKKIEGAYKKVKVKVELRVAKIEKQREMEAAAANAAAVT